MLSTPVHKCLGFKKMLEPLVDLDSGKYEAYLPEIAVHKAIERTSKAKLLAIFNVTDTAKGGSLSPFA